MRFVIRILWCMPVVLIVLGINQVMVACSLKSTWEEGYETVAVVTEFAQSNRADVNFGYVSLKIPLEGGGELVKEGLSLPYTLLARLAGSDSLEVRVRPGASQDVAIVYLMPTHWHIVLAQIGICILGTVFFFGGILAVRRWAKWRSPQYVTE